MLSIALDIRFRPFPSPSPSLCRLDHPVTSRLDHPVTSRLDDFETPLSQSSTLLIDPDAYDELGGSLTARQRSPRARMVRSIVADVLACAMLDIPCGDFPRRLDQHSGRWKRPLGGPPPKTPPDTTLIVSVTPRRGLRPVQAATTQGERQITLTFSLPAYVSWRVVELGGKFRSGWTTPAGLAVQRGLVRGLLDEALRPLLRI